MPADLDAPLEAFESEDGDTWWLNGHRPNAEAIAAVRRATEDFWKPGEVLDEEFCVTRGWWRDAK